MRKLIAPLIRGIPATTHGPPAMLEDSPARSLLLPGHDAGTGNNLFNFTLKPTARAPNRFTTGADNLGKTSNAIDFGALGDLIAAGRASAAAVHIA